jgi:tRNA(Ile)-lysidine synthase
LLDTVRKYIAQNQLFEERQNLLLAVSGGVDSVVLVDVLHHLQFYFLSVAHCNFQLRGEESDEDEAFVRKLATKYRLPFFVKRFDTQEFASKNKLSIQVAARQLRYAWFDEILLSQQIPLLVTAHHQNDNIETIIYNLAKGTGIAGLHGILPKNGNIVRPLLCVSKEEILQYATENQLSWREDSSNESDKYSRNLIRHRVVPILKQLNPKLENTFQENIEKIYAVENIFKNVVNEFKNRALKEIDAIYYLDIEVLRKESENQIKLYEILKDFGFNYSQIKQIINALDSEAGKLFTSNTHTLVKDRKHLVLAPIQIKNEAIQFEKKSPIVTHYNFTLELYTVPKSPDFQFSTDANIAHLDFDKLSENLTVRNFEHGDEFCPLGMKGKKKKLTDFLNDLKIPLNLKNQVLLLLSDKQIAWVIGHRIDDRFKITEKTQTVLEIRYIIKQQS